MILFGKRCNEKLREDNFYKKNRSKDFLNKLLCQVESNFRSEKRLTKQIYETNRIFNNRTLFVGLSFSGRTYLVMKNFKDIVNRTYFVVITKSPEQYKDDFKTEEEIREKVIMMLVL